MKEQFTYTVAASMNRAVETYKKTDFFIASMKKAGARSIKIIEEEALPDGGMRWKARITETARLPEFLRTSEILIIVNESAFYPKKKKLEFRISPSALTIPVVLRGSIDLLEADNETNLVYNIDLSIGLPLFGRRTEMLGLKVVKDECRKQAALLEEWARMD